MQVTSTPTITQPFYFRVQFFSHTMVMWKIMHLIQHQLQSLRPQRLFCCTVFRKPMNFWSWADPDMVWCFPRFWILRLVRQILLFSSFKSFGFSSSECDSFLSLYLHCVVFSFIHAFEWLRTGEWPKLVNWLALKLAWILWIFSMKKRRCRFILGLLSRLLRQSWLVYSLLLISKFQVIWGNILLQSSNILLQVTSYVITVPKQKWEFPVLAWGKKVHLGSNIVCPFDFLSTF